HWHLARETRYLLRRMETCGSKRRMASMLTKARQRCSRNLARLVAVRAETVNNDSCEFGVLSVRLRRRDGPVEELSRLIGLPTSREWRSTDLLDRGKERESRKRGENYWASDFVLREREFGNVVEAAIQALYPHRKGLDRFLT